MEIRDLQETAALAHLLMSEQELREAFPAFEEMLSFFAVMQAADAQSGDADGGMAASSRVVNAGYFRPDAAPPAREDLSEDMLTKAGERDERFITIPNVL
ncbi:MAG: aspartyl/glutamyl-tRNA amidotransferase subunit C [Spirochaetota bacterium]|jgi:aspartyl-tRNA(Asn)/glutamyl-tRNA(Gln) amidotransferase subunit C|nr:aspartyl/glutamyl-tRNA amidotransferase subunit C [Spirochaetota bacterium]